MRLIDADALMRKLTISPCGTRYREYDCDNFPATLTLIEVKKMVRNEPTVAKDNNVPIKQPDLEWVKTADRLPTKADAGVDEEIVTIYDDGETRIMGADYWAYVAKVPERFPYWLPVPKLPEVEG